MIIFLTRQVKRKKQEKVGYRNTEQGEASLRGPAKLS